MQIRRAKLRNLVLQCRLPIAAVLFVGLYTGCASLSLFSSTHTHESADTKQRLETLEQRVNQLEGRPPCPTDSEFGPAIPDPVFVPAPVE